MFGPELLILEWMDALLLTEIPSKEKSLLVLPMILATLHTLSHILLKDSITMENLLKETKTSLTPKQVPIYKVKSTQYYHTLLI